MSGLGKLAHTIAPKPLPAAAITIDEKSDIVLQSLDRAITSASIDHRPESKGTFHSANLGSSCDRFLYLHYNGLLPPSSVDAITQRKFDYGHTAEPRYKQYFQNMHSYIADEQPARIDDPPIHGRVDFLLTLPQIGLKQVVAELKTINDSGFKALTEATYYHTVQLQTYLNILDISHGFVLYENKNTQAVKIFFQEKNVVLWDALVDKCYRIMGLSELPKLKVLNHDRYCRCLTYKNK